MKIDQFQHKLAFWGEEDTYILYVLFFKRPVFSWTAANNPV